MDPKRGKYEVRWLEGGRHPSRLFDRKGDADAFDLEKKRQRQLGALAPTVMRSRITLAEFMAEDWWLRYAIPNLAEDTRRRYLEVWGTHLLPRLGDYELRAITPWLVEDFRADLERVKVGAPTVRKAMMLLQGILRRAVVRGLMTSNPVQAGHSVATLARHYAGVLRELEHAPRTPAAKAIRAARERISVATGLRRDEGGES